jgi:hypothetical protein
METFMTILIVVFSFLAFVGAFWLARVLDRVNRLDPPQLPEGHPDQLVLENEFNKAVNARHNDAEVDQWIDAVELAPSVMEGESIKKLAVGYCYPLRFKKKNGVVRDYVAFTVTTVQTLADGEVFYTGIDGQPSDPSSWRVAGFRHSQLLAVWPCEIISPAIILTMKAEIRIRNNPNL